MKPNNHIVIAKITAMKDSDKTIVHEEIASLILEGTTLIRSEISGDTSIDDPMLSPKMIASIVWLFRNFEELRPSLRTDPKMIRLKRIFEDKEAGMIFDVKIIQVRSDLSLDEVRTYALSLNGIKNVIFRGGYTRYSFTGDHNPAPYF